MSYSNQQQEMGEGRCPSLRDCVHQALEREQRILAQREVKLDADLDEVPGLPLSDEARRAVIDFIHQLVPAACPQTSVSITLVNGNHQWELEVAGVFADDAELNPETTRWDPDLWGDRAHELSPATNLELQRLAMRCGGEVERWLCPQGGAAIVLVVPKYLASQRRAA